MTARKGRNGGGELADRDALKGLKTPPCYAMPCLNTGLFRFGARFVQIQPSLRAVNSPPASPVFMTPHGPMIRASFSMCLIAESGMGWLEA